MKVILDIDSKALEIIQKDGIINSENKITNVWVASEFMDALDNAVTLPDNATNGDVIKAMFNCMVIDITDGKVYVEKFYVPFNEAWWEAPYQGGQEE